VAELDQAVVNLERFLGLLANATSAVGQVEDHVVQRGREFGELENEAADAGGGLNDRLEEVATMLEAQEAEAVAALGELSQGADGAQQDVAEVDDQVGQAATDLEGAADDVEKTLEQAGTALDGEGFEPFARALENAQQELQAAAHETGQALTELAGAVSNLEASAETDWTEAEAEMETSAAALASAETAIESAAQDGVQGFDAAADALESACGSLVKDVDVIYDALDSGVEAQGQEWEQAVDASAQGAQAFVGDAREQRLETAASTVNDEALATLDQEYEALGSVLDGAAAPMGDLPPLSAELVRAQSVVGQIDELMSALG
jgi:chromosome segregation ATPase